VGHRQHYGLPINRSIEPEMQDKKRARNICLTIAYDGTDFHGWQRQPDQLTVQGCLEAAIGRITGSPASLWGSGRTDAGVHALRQVANFKTTSRIPCSNLVTALNDVIPPTIRIQRAREVRESFHARYDVRSKTYWYRILQTRVCSPFLSRFVCHHSYPLDRIQMSRAARLLEGNHDFTSFAAAGEHDVTGPGTRLLQHNPSLDARPVDPQRPMNREPLQLDGEPLAQRSSSMVRIINSSRFLWRPRTSMLIYQISGSGFLHHMVRNIVGTLLEVGRGKLTPEEVIAILQARERTRAGPTAPAPGLCLMKVEY
jgi:tRNA pseudouridine38-40 synthase